MSNENTTMEEYLEETVTVSELFQEELDLVVQQIDELIDTGRDKDLALAERLEAVVEYLKNRIKAIRELESMRNSTLH